MLSAVNADRLFIEDEAVELMYNVITNSLIMVEQTAKN
jgi:hypothetical protein